MARSRPIVSAPVSAATWPCGSWGLPPRRILLLTPPRARADVAWTLATTGDWLVATNWSGGALPASSDTATCANGGTVTVTQTGETCSVLSLGSSAGSGTVQLNAGARCPPTTSTWAIPAAAPLRSRAGPTRSSPLYSLLYIGGNSINSTTGTGTYNLNAGLLSIPYVYVGDSGTGTFTQSGGTNSTVFLGLGWQPGSSGTYNLNGGMLALSAFGPGLGSGTLNLNGGTLQVNSAFTITQPLLLNTSGGTFTVDTGTGSMVTLSGALSGTGGLTETGGGTLIISGTNNTCQRFADGQLRHLATEQLGCRPILHRGRQRCGRPGLRPGV